MIATDLRAEIPAGFKAGAVAYPKGELHTFTFSKKPLNVYQGTVTLRMPLTALPSAPGFAGNPTETAISGVQYGNLFAAGDH